VINGVYLVFINKALKGNTGFNYKFWMPWQDYRLSGVPCNPERSGNQYSIWTNPGIRKNVLIPADNMQCLSMSPHVQVYVSSKEDHHL
jgi:hypothetical protein